MTIAIVIAMFFLTGLLCAVVIIGENKYNKDD